jgi:hypothetical protein
VDAIRLASGEIPGKVSGTLFESVNKIVRSDQVQKETKTVDPRRPTPNFSTAKKFVEALNGKKGVPYLNHTNWQLPATPPCDSSRDSTGPPPPRNNFGYGSAGSAMGALYNVLFHLSCIQA